MSDLLAMSSKERRRKGLLELLKAEAIDLSQAAEAAGLSLRQLRRVRRRAESDGDVGLVHRGRGRPPVNRTSDELRRRALELATGRYALFNDTHLCEVLASEHDIKLGRETLRRLLRDGGKKAKRSRKPQRYRRRRTPAPRRGDLVLWDGSKHRWLGPHMPWSVLMAAVDDASGALLAAFFCPAETSVAYLQLLSALLHHGRPHAIYHDRHTSLVRNDGHWSIEEQLADRQLPTQVGIALEDLGIQQILSYAPQGRGRIERLFRTLQDRLLAELSLHNFTTLDQANAFLSGTFIAAHNKRFGHVPALPEDSFRPLQSLDPKKILSLRYARTVAADNTVTLGSFHIQLPEGPRRRSFAKAKADVRHHLDGSWTVYIDGRPVASHPPTQLLDPTRVRFRTHIKKTKGPEQVLLVYLPDDSVAATPIP
jgi:transposase